MPRITLPEPHRGLYAVGPLLFEDGVFEQDEPLTPVQLRLAEALYADVQGGEDPEPDAFDEGASGRHAAEESAGADAPVGSPVTPPEEVAAAARTEGSISTVGSQSDGSETTEAPGAAPTAEPEGDQQ